MKPLKRALMLVIIAALVGLSPNVVKAADARFEVNSACPIIVADAELVRDPADDAAGIPMFNIKVTMGGESHNYGKQYYGIMLVKVTDSYDPHWRSYGIYVVPGTIADTYFGPYTIGRFSGNIHHPIYNDASIHVQLHCSPIPEDILRNFPK